ncbi:MAG: FAD binding domain-containing protein [Bacillota bacterium]|jgi:CO/xanthine dehydrogenase FAD-binding subunit
MYQDYYRPDNLKEALDILAFHKGKARIIAGGTDLVLDINKGTKQADFLVDIRKIPELNIVEERGTDIYIGAGVTHTQLVNNRIINNKAKVLSEAAQTVGSLQVRNIGTVGGNVVNAQPAADTAVALVSLDAKAEIISTDQSKQIVSVENIYKGPGKSVVDSTSSILTGFYISMPEATLSAFDRIARRKSLSLPILNLAVVLRKDKNVCQEIRIAAGPISLQPLRLRPVESFLMGKELSQEIINGAGELISQIANPRESVLRGSSAYRKELLGMMLKRTLSNLAVQK